MESTDTPDLPAAGDAASHAAGPGFGRLLQRYLLPVGLCDTPSGDLFAERAALERNKQILRRWMPHYAKVHTVLAGSLLTVCTGAHASEVPGWVVAAAAITTVGELALAITFGCIALVLRLGRD